MFKYVALSVLLTACAEHVDTAQNVQMNPSLEKLNTTEVVAPARDGNIAIAEEFESAKIKNTVEAYDLFIARHPNHNLASQAKSLRLIALKPQLK